MQKLFFYDSPIGQIGVIEQEEIIVQVLFETMATPKQVRIEETPLLKKAGEQLDEYFTGRRRAFDLPIQAKGTPFEQRVWIHIQGIGYGRTKSYLNVAKALGSKHGARAVGGASGKNPIPIFIPCHRVVGLRGGLVGYSGGIERKKYLLDLEKKNDEQN